MRSNVTWFMNSLRVATPRPKSALTFYTLTVLIMLLTYVLANSFQNVSDILDVFFSLAGGLLVFIGPAVLWYLVNRNEEKDQFSKVSTSIAKESSKENSAMLVAELDADYEAARQTFMQGPSLLWKFVAALNVLLGLFVLFAGTFFSLKKIFVN
jgi:hypothetical protein